jgi:uncharacterized membrane protein
VTVVEPRPAQGRPRAIQAIAALFVVTGVLHFVIPHSYTSIVPPFLPARLFLVYLSGALELVGGAGLLIPRTRRPAALALIALLAAVFPANVQMLANAVAAVEEWARCQSATEVHLNVWTFNEAAVRLYADIGYAPRTQLMVKRLPSLEPKAGRS